MPGAAQSHPNHCLAEWPLPGGKVRMGDFDSLIWFVGALRAYPGQPHTTIKNRLRDAAKKGVI